MASRSADKQTFSVEGEVVELLEKSGQRLAKIVITTPVVIDITGDEAESLHLGDRVAVHGWMGVEKEAL